MELLFEQLDRNSQKPLYKQLSTLLENKIVKEEIKVGNKLPTVEVLCKTFNVSHPTVREAISHLVKAGYLSCRPNHGTIVINSKSKSVDFNKRNKVGLINFISTKEELYNMAVSSDNFHEQVILRGIEAKVAEKGIHLIYKNITGNELGLESIEDEIAGLIITGIVTTERYKEIKKAKLPFVFIEDILEKEKTNRDVDVVASNDFDRIYTATKHMAEAGHKRIVYINRTLYRYSWDIEQLNGYKQALKEANIAFDEKLVIETRNTGVGEGYNEMKEFLNSSIAFSGIVCVSLIHYTGIIKAFSERGLKIPEDVSIILCCKPPEANITSVEYDVEELGRTAVGLLDEKLRNNGEWKPKRIIIPSKLIIQNSVKQII